MQKQKIQISVVLPCLNEQATIGLCISKAKKTLRTIGKPYEIIVVDNGSTDKSIEKSIQSGAKVLKEKIKGYGVACHKGITQSCGEFIVMGDSDNTYDFRTLAKFIEQLENGADLVLGSRFLGSIEPDAMPFTHRYIGNPLLTFMLNLFYGTHISDAHTGLRAFKKSSYLKMDIHSRGMEFASEMIIKAIYFHFRIIEIPIRYFKRRGQSKLSPISDGLRHIKYILLYSPTYTFIIPGLFLFLSGFIMSLFLLPGGQKLLGWYFDIHSMTVGILFGNLGMQLILFGIFARVYTYTVLKLPPGPLGGLILSLFTFSRLLLIGIFLFFIGITKLGFISFFWLLSGFGELSKVRDILFAVGLTVISTQIIFFSLLFELIKERDE